MRSSVFHLVVTGYAGAGKSELVRFLLDKYSNRCSGVKCSVFNYDVTDFLDNDDSGRRASGAALDLVHDEVIFTPSSAVHSFLATVFTNLTSNASALKILSFNYDKLAHLVLHDACGVKTLQERDRLATEVFKEPEKLESLEMLIHPAVYALAGRIFEVARAECSSPNSPDDVTLVVIHEIPLWWETRELFMQKFSQDPDCVVVLTVDEKTQTCRLLARGYSLDRIVRIRQKQLKLKDWEDIQTIAREIISIF